MFILAFAFSCKSTGDNTVKFKGNDPTKFVIDEKKINNDELRKNMKSLFELMENYISKGNFEGWYNFLSKNYKIFLNNREKLAMMSDLSDYLYNRKIKLKTPEDYFKYLVVAARDGKTLEFLDYEVVNKNSVKVTCLFDKKEKYIYKFVYEDSSWKLDRD
jgi:hypothetical protein